MPGAISFPQSQSELHSHSRNVSFGNTSRINANSKGGMIENFSMSNFSNSCHSQYHNPENLRSEISAGDHSSSSSLPKNPQPSNAIKFSPYHRNRRLDNDVQVPGALHGNNMNLNNSSPVSSPSQHSHSSRPDSRCSQYSVASGTSGNISSHSAARRTESRRGGRGGRASRSPMPRESNRSNGGVNNGPSTPLAVMHNGINRHSSPANGSNASNRMTTGREISDNIHMNRGRLVKKNGNSEAYNRMKGPSSAAAAAAATAQWYNNQGHGADEYMFLDDSTGFVGDQSYGNLADEHGEAYNVNNHTGGRNWQRGKHRRSGNTDKNIRKSIRTEQSTIQSNTDDLTRRQFDGDQQHAGDVDRYGDKDGSSYLNVQNQHYESYNNERHGHHHPMDHNQQQRNKNQQQQQICSNDSFNHRNQPMLGANSKNRHYTPIQNKDHLNNFINENEYSSHHTKRDCYPSSDSYENNSTNIERGISPTSMSTAIQDNTTNHHASTSARPHRSLSRNIMLDTDPRDIRTRETTKSSNPNIMPRRRSSKSDKSVSSVFRRPNGGQGKKMDHHSNDDENSPQNILLSIRTQSRSFDINCDEENGTATDTEKPNRKNVASDNNLLNKNRDRITGKRDIHLKRKHPPRSLEEPPQILHRHPPQSNPAFLFGEQQRRPHTSHPNENDFQISPNKSNSVSGIGLSTSFTPFASFDVLDIGDAPPFKNNTCNLSEIFGTTQSFPRSVPSLDATCAQTPHKKMQARPHNDECKDSLPHGNSSGALLTGITPTNSFGEPIESLEEGCALVDSTSTELLSLRSFNGKYKSNTSIDELVSSHNSSIVNVPSSSFEPSNGAKNLEQSNNRFIEEIASSSDVYLNAARSFPSDESFYDVLIHHKEAFDCCRFILPGLKSDFSEKDVDASPTEPHVNKKKDHIIQDHYSTESSSVASSSESSIASNDVIARRRVKSAVCAFGGVYTSHYRRHKVDKCVSINRSKFCKKLKLEEQLKLEKIEEKAHIEPSKNIKFGKKKRFGCAENGSRISWDAEESPDIIKSSSPSRKKIKRSHNVKVLPDTLPSSTIAQLPRNDIIESSDVKSSDIVSNSDDECRRIDTTLFKDLKNLSSKPSSDLNSEFDGDKDKDDVSENSENENQGKMRYRCKLCGKPKQNHICPFQQSLQRSIGVNVFPVVNAFTACEPGHLAPALDEMNNFVSGQESSSTENTPSRSSPTSSIGKSPNPMLVTSQKQLPTVTPETLKSGMHQRNISNQCLNSPSVMSTLSVGTPQRSSFRRTSNDHPTPSTSNQRKCFSSDVNNISHNFMKSTELRPEQYRIVSVSASQEENMYVYPHLSLPDKQRISLSDNLYRLSKEVPLLTNDCAAILRVAQEKDMWDVAVAELITQVIVVMHCPKEDNRLDGLSHYLLSLGFSC